MLERSRFGNVHGSELAIPKMSDLGDISEEEILRTVREYRSGRKKLPEITVVARSKKKTA